MMKCTIQGLIGLISWHKMSLDLSSSMCNSKGGIESKFIAVLCRRTVAVKSRAMKNSLKLEVVQLYSWPRNLLLIFPIVVSNYNSTKFFPWEKVDLYKKCNCIL